MLMFHTEIYNGPLQIIKKKIVWALTKLLGVSVTHTN